jgi:tetratricopeptide (TPR) repeat protein
MSDKEIVFEFAKIFGLNEVQSWLFKIILDYNPESQEELLSKYNEVMIERGIQKRVYSKGSISKACKKLEEKNLVKPVRKFKNRVKYDLDEEKLELTRRLTRKLEFTRLERILKQIPSNILDSPEVQSAHDFFKKEQEMYNQGDYWAAKESLNDVKKNLSPFHESSRQRLLGWCNYYISYKKLQPPWSTKEITSFKPWGDEARDAFIEVLKIKKSSEDVNSALSGLPLVYYFLLKEPQKAFKVAEEAKRISSNKASVYNTIALLKRQENLHIEALQAFSQAFQEGERMKDYRTCGNALNNKARVLKFIFPQLYELKFENTFLKQLKNEIKIQFKKLLNSISLYTQKPLYT